MPEEVRTEISTQFVDRSVMNEDDDAFKRIPLLDDSAPLHSTGLAVLSNIFPFFFFTGLENVCLHN